jgi:hypothetical protein
VGLHGLPYRVLTEGPLDLPSEKIGLESGAFWLARISSALLTYLESLIPVGNGIALKKNIVGSDIAKLPAIAPVNFLIQ